MIVVDHSHREFDVIRELWFDVIKDEIFLFGNNTLNECILNTKQTKNNSKYLTFCSNFFNLLTRWSSNKFESLSSLLKVYRMYPESTKKNL